MKRKIIDINEEKCNGCGLCVGVCAEAALEIIDGKARLVKDFYCDGMGACLDVCPVDALKIVEKDAAEYDVQKTVEHVRKARGDEAVADVHGAEITEEPMACGCPGTMMRDFTTDKKTVSQAANTNLNLNSELRQWPIQLHLLSPAAPYFKNADLVIVADCVPFAYANFHQKFLKDKILIMFCPKLDSGQDLYLEKLTEIFKTQNIKSIQIVHMEVPCCSGVGAIVQQALEKSGKNIIIKDYTISLQGEII